MKFQLLTSYKQNYAAPVPKDAIWISVRTSNFDMDIETLSHATVIRLHFAKVVI